MNFETNIGAMTRKKSAARHLGEGEVKWYVVAAQYFEAPIFRCRDAKMFRCRDAKSPKVLERGEGGVQSQIHIDLPF